MGEMPDKNVKKGRFISTASTRLQRILMTRWRNEEHEQRDVLKVKPVKKENKVVVIIGAMGFFLGIVGD